MKQLEKSIFEEYYSEIEFLDFYSEHNSDGVDVIIPVIHTNELWEANLLSIYREIPVRRLLISDGGCIDNSIDIVKKFPRVVILDHKSFKSLGYCLRKLIEEVQTEWFIYLHSDVYLPPNWFSSMIQYRDKYDWFGCIQKITTMVEHTNTDRMSGIARPHAGSQMGRTVAFSNGIKEIDDDFVYRQEDLVLVELVEKHGYKHGSIDDVFHYHQVMHKESPWGRVINSVAVNVEWNQDELIRGSTMQIKGILKYLRPSRMLQFEIENHLKILSNSGTFDFDEYESWVQEFNPAWQGVVKPWRVRAKVLLSKYLNFVRNFAR